MNGNILKYLFLWCANAYKTTHGNRFSSYSPCNQQIIEGCFEDKQSWTMIYENNIIHRYICIHTYIHLYVWSNITHTYIYRWGEEDLTVDTCTVDMYNLDSTVFTINRFIVMMTMPISEALILRLYSISFRQECCQHCEVICIVYFIGNVLCENTNSQNTSMYTHTKSNNAQTVVRRHTSTHKWSYTYLIIQTH